MSKKIDEDFYKLLKEVNLKLGRKESDVDKMIEEAVAEEAQEEYKQIAEELNKESEIKKDLAKAILPVAEPKKKKNETPEEKEKRKRLKGIREPIFTENELRHKKFKEIKEAREDLSSQVKDVITKLQDEGRYKLATYHGRAGGNRKLLKCPHCDGIMLAAGIKIQRNVDSSKPRSQSQREWQDYVKAVAKIPDYKGLSRAKILQAASVLRGKGYTIDEIKDESS